MILCWHFFGTLFFGNLFLSWKNHIKPILNLQCMPTMHSSRKATLCISPVCWRDFPLVNSQAKELALSPMSAFHDQIKIKITFYTSHLFQIILRHCWGHCWQSHMGFCLPVSLSRQCSISFGSYFSRMVFSDFLTKSVVFKFKLLNLDTNTAQLIFQ